MKRGRPDVRDKVQSNLVSILSTSETPLTVSTLTRFVSKDFNRTVSWNTVQKYLDELVEGEKVQAIQLPHSKIEDRMGLTVYVMKK